MENIGEYVMLQTEKLKSLSEVHNLEEVVTCRAKLQYISCCTRPDLCSPSQLLAAVASNPTPKAYKEINKIVRWTHDTATQGLKFVPLELNSLRLMLFTDAAFANTDEFKSKLGFFVLLADGKNNANIVHYGSTRCCRVTRSVLASELHALSYGLDNGYIVRETIQDILQRSIPIEVYIDSRTLFNVITKFGATKEKRLQINASSSRQSYSKGEMEKICWIFGSQNLADALTKSLLTTSHALWNTMVRNKVIVSPRGWVFKPSPPF